MVTYLDRGEESRTVAKDNSRDLRFEQQQGYVSRGSSCVRIFEDSDGLRGVGRIDGGTRRRFGARNRGCECRT